MKPQPGGSAAKKSGDSLDQINAQIVQCIRCPRLVQWRQAAAQEPPVRYRGQRYWARPLPGFGDPAAALLIVGLAPAAHGGNRTGRIFTGDRSGDWLFRGLHRAGFASKPTSEHASDGLKLAGCYISAVVRCAPPANKPLPQERDNCLPYLVRELEVLDTLRVVVALGAFAWEGAIRALRSLGRTVPSPKVRFGHGVVCEAGGLKLVGSYHPSQQNTFTGKLTEEAFDEIFATARRLLGSSTPQPL